MAACCSPLTTSTAARSTTSGHSTVASAADSGRSAPNARTAGSAEQGSAPAWRSTEVIATASSPTAHEVVRSPKSMIPSGVRSPRSRRQTTLSSVTSPCTACHGSSPASGSTRRQAAAAAPETRARSSSSRTCPASASTTRSAYRRSHCSTRSSPGWVNGPSARLTCPATVPRAVTTRGDR